MKKGVWEPWKEYVRALIASSHDDFVYEDLIAKFHNKPEQELVAMALSIGQLILEGEDPKLGARLHKPSLALCVLNDFDCNTCAAKDKRSLWKLTCRIPTAEVDVAIKIYERLYGEYLDAKG